MQVVACAVAGAAYITYNLPCRYRFPCGDGSLRHVGVPRGQARAVIQQHLIAVAVVPAADQHRTAVGGEDRRTLRCGNVRAAMPGIAEGVRFPEVAGYIGVTRQRPAQFTVRNSNPAAQGKQTGAHFLGKQLVQNLPLVLRKAVQIRQRVHRFAADRDVQNVLTGSGSGSSSVGSGVAVTSSTSASISCIAQKVS